MKKRFEVLDAFRGICALSVVVFHLRLIGSITEIEFFRNSKFFVEFFFVLSGFVLAHGYGFKNNLKFYPFMRMRFFRLYPLHFFMLAVFLLFEIGKLLAYKYVGLNFNTLPFSQQNSLSEVLPNLLLIQSWAQFADSTSFNFPSWSISIEFYLYVLLFISMVTFKKYKTVSWLLISIIAFNFLYIGSDIFKEEVFRGLSCFFGGASTYVLYKQVAHLKPSYLMGSIIEILLIFLIILVLQSKIEHMGIIASAIFIISVLVFSYEAGCLSKILKTKYFQYFGKLSYSIYMVHAAVIFIITSAAMLLGKYTGNVYSPTIDSIRYIDFGNSLINNLIVLFTLVSVVFISKYTYKYIEYKFLQIGKNNKPS